MPVAFLVSPDRLYCLCFGSKVGHYVSSAKKLYHSANDLSLLFLSVIPQLVPLAIPIDHTRNGEGNFPGCKSDLVHINAIKAAVYRFKLMSSHLVLREYHQKQWRLLSSLRTCVFHVMRMSATSTTAARALGPEARPRSHPLQLRLPDRSLA